VVDSDDLGPVAGLRASDLKMVVPEMQCMNVFLKPQLLID
jgi:hypothetical protein